MDRDKQVCALAKETIWIQKIAQAMSRDEGGLQTQSRVWESAPHAI